MTKLTYREHFLGFVPGYLCGLMIERPARPAIFLQGGRKPHTKPTKSQARKLKRAAHYAWFRFNKTSRPIRETYR